MGRYPEGRGTRGSPEKEEGWSGCCESEDVAQQHYGVSGAESSEGSLSLESFIAIEFISSMAGRYGAQFCGVCKAMVKFCLFMLH